MICANTERAFWEYLKARETVRLRKEADQIAIAEGESPQGPPWTDDPILQQYKFTNVHRENDSTSRRLIDRFYRPHWDDEKDDILLNAAIFRWFGLYETANLIGWTHADYWPQSRERIREQLKDRRSDGHKIFTGAYIISTAGISGDKIDYVLDYVIHDLWCTLDNVVDIAEETYSWERVAKYMKAIRGFGADFMTKEVLLDTMYTGFWSDGGGYQFGDFVYPVDYGSWTPVGPGARRGAARICMEYDKPKAMLSPKRTLETIIQMSKWQEAHWPVADRGALSLHEIQFGLCEFDKYERVRTGEGTPRSKYPGTG